MMAGIVLLFIVFYLGVFSFVAGLVVYLYFRKKAFYSCDYCDESLKGGKYVIGGYFDSQNIFKIQMIEFDINVTCPQCNKKTTINRKMRMYKFFKKEERWINLQHKEFKKYLEN